VGEVHARAGPHLEHPATGLREHLAPALGQAGALARREEVLVAGCEGASPEAHRPRVRFIDEVPKTATGKYDKKVLRKRLEEDELGKRRMTVGQERAAAVNPGL
jgi:hypothetical protein